MSEDSRYLAAIMFTDIVGYTTIMGSDEQKAIELLRINREIQKPLIEQYGGRWIKEMGDGVLAQFTSALDSVKCALAIQKLAVKDFPGSIRIGIHLGDITTENDDVFGDGVNISSRLQSIADPGGIYISDSVYQAIRGRSDIQAKSLGDIQLKNVDHLVKIYFLLDDGLPVPSAERRSELSHPSGKATYQSIFYYALIIIVLLAGGWWAWSTYFIDKPNSIESLAVLPFTAISEEVDQEYLMAGMHDALINELSKISAIRVISKRSTLKYRNSEMSIPEIAKELGVDALVEPSAFVSGDSLRIQVQLIEAYPEERNAWHETYNRNIGNIFNTCSEISQTIAKEINVSLTPTDETMLANTREVNPETYKAYLRGMYYLNQYTPEGFAKGMEYLNNAIEIDPADPLAYAGLAQGYNILAHGPNPPDGAYTKAKAAARKALSLDPTLAAAHASMAEIKLYQDWEWEAADEAFQYALRLNSSLADTRSHYSWYLLLMGRIDEALAEMKLAQQTDPLTPILPAWLGWQYLWDGQFEKAIAEAEKAFELNADFTVAYYVAGCAYAYKGLYDEAIKMHKRAFEIDPSWEFALAKTYALTGHVSQAEEMLTKLEAENSKWNTLFLAQIYTILGDNEKAILWLEEAYTDPPHPYMPWINKAYSFRSLQNDPRFNDLIIRMNLPANESPVL